MKRTCTIILVLLVGVVKAQFTVAPGTSMAAANGTDISMNIKGNISNGSSFDFTGTNLNLTLLANTAAQTIGGNIVASLLNISASTNTMVSGTLTVTNSMYFKTGTLEASAAGTKILYTGSADNISGDETGTFDDSYVIGPFSILSGGKNFFPIGTAQLGYTPAILEQGNGTDEIAIEAVDGDANFTIDESIPEMDHSHYWQITASDIKALNTKITLGLNGVPPFSSDYSSVVLQADNIGSTPDNLLSVSDGVLITSKKIVTKPVVAIGASAEVDVVIHDIITPYLVDNANDQLYIENIDKFLVNKVTLLDRWGVLVKEWKNFSNYTDPINPNTDGYDFKKLSPGNYICVVEYGDPDIGFSKKSQMITVLKAK